MTIDVLMMNRIRSMAPQRLKQFLEDIESSSRVEGYKVGYQDGLKEGEAEFDTGTTEEQMTYLNNSTECTALTNDEWVEICGLYGVRELEAKMILKEAERRAHSGRD